MSDPIVDEVRKIREEILASHGGNFDRYCRDVMKRQGSSGHALVSGPPRKVKGVKAAEARATYKPGA
jgi:hypothetical protein